ncbi:C6 zinc finger domain-containing protein [Colletotrichum truncatum]|uniref:C6 zinc finger domain-containing protein n=1 Tax=Colletotrichum truncatum TaxID=5467 RepID=A0ACC3YU49_COLTU|nr:C6 zinc finger domain-containing protein [Colletotrichum truncatum]KAF6798668.1 C6 zinc finger domain-containing protein [Colletotrichum truncatum]
MASGIVCPGYEDKKPLTWVTPNKPTARTWRGRRPAFDKLGDAKKDQKPGEKEEAARKAIYDSQLMHIFPRQELRTETCDIAEASHYWNEYVYPCFYSNQLTKSPWVVPISNIHTMKPYRRHGLVTMAIEHRMARLSPSKGDPYAAEVRARAYQHRFTAIQALNKEIENESTRCSDATLGGVIVFLFGDLMGAATAPNWRVHINGFAALVDLRGGWEKLCQQSPHLKSLVLFCKVVENFANTTSPAHDQTSPLTNFTIRALMRDVYSIGYYPQLPCPVDLFIDIIQINRLRSLAINQRPEDTMRRIQSEAETLLKKMLQFSFTEWINTMEVEGKALFNEYLMMGKIYQSAVVLFGVSSLQSARAIPLSEEWMVVKNSHIERLFSLLKKSTASQALRMCTTWPMIVAGFEAKAGSPSMRAFILGHMEEDSRQLGIYLPVAAKGVLERFYASAGEAWDDCFDSPNALFT